VLLVMLTSTTMAEKTFVQQTTTTMTTTRFRTTVAVSPRQLIITRTSGRPSTSSSKLTTRGDVADAARFSEGAYATQTSAGVNHVKMSRDQEKKDMQDLNDRFADYIDKVRNKRCNNCVYLFL